MLMLDPIDGLAHGLVAVTVTIYISLHRQVALAEA